MRCPDCGYIRLDQLAPCPKCWPAKKQTPHHEGEKIMPTREELKKILTGEPETPPAAEKRKRSTDPLLVIRRILRTTEGMSAGDLLYLREKINTILTILAGKE